MALHADMLNQIVSAASVSFWKPEQKRKYAGDIDDSLFSMSSVAMTPEEIQKMQEIRKVLGLPPILGLPTELLWQIFHHLPQKEKSSFRSTNKQLHVAVKKPFAKTIPSVWRVSMMKESLQSLVSLTADQDFAPNCKSISFGIGRVIHNTVPDIKHEQAVEDQPASNRRFEQHSRFINDGEHIELLVEALMNLKRNGNKRIALVIIDAQIELEDFVINESHSPSWPQMNEISITIAAIQTGVERSGLAVHQMTVDQHYDALITKPELMFWKKLTPIPRLRIMSSHGAEINIYPEEAELEMIWHSFLIQGTERGIMRRYFCEDLYGALYQEVVNIKYRKMTLGASGADYRSIKELVCLDSLEDLRLYSIDFRPTEYSEDIMAAAFFQSIRNLPKLGNLKLSNIHDERFGVIVPSRQEVKWQGQEQVHIGLDDLIRKTSHWT